MEGDLSLLSIPDLLQMICLGGYSRDIHLFDGATQLGVIAIRNGRIDRCFGFGMWGADALYKLINLRRGRYKVNDATDMSASDSTLTSHSWQELLIEAVRQEDEAAHALRSTASAGRVIAFPTPAAHAASFESGPTASAIPRVVPELDWSEPAEVAMEPRPHPGALPSGGGPRPSTGHADIAELMQEATTCYLRRDLARAEALLQQCLVLRPGDKRVLQNLERIRRKKSP